MYSLSRLQTGLSCLAALLIFHTGLASAQAQQPTPQERAAMLKQWMAASQAQLRNYQWTTETVITIDGEKKHDTRDRCYYGDDGTLQKVPMGDSVKQSEGLPGILPPGKLINMFAKHKQKEMEEFINGASALLHSYIPPQTTDIQAAIQAGLMSVNILEPGKRVELVFTDFKKPGDQLGVEIELPTNRLLGLELKSYVDSPDDPVTADVTMNVMADGTIYTQKAQLTASSKDLVIDISNSDYQRIKQ
jgi:hypothetical protein